MTGRRLPDTWRGGDETKRLVVGLDDEFYADLKELSRRRKTTMANLVRYAVDKTFEDELDVIAGERALEEAARDPSSSVSWEEVKKELRVAVSDPVQKSRSTTAKQAPAKRSKASGASNRKSAIRAVS